MGLKSFWISRVCLQGDSGLGWGSCCLASWWWSVTLREELSVDLVCAVNDTEPRFLSYWATSPPTALTVSVPPLEPIRPTFIAQLHLFSSKLRLRVGLFTFSGFFRLMVYHPYCYYDFNRMVYRPATCLMVILSSYWWDRSSSISWYLTVC